MNKHDRSHSNGQVPLGAMLCGNSKSEFITDSSFTVTGELETSTMWYVRFDDNHVRGLYDEINGLYDNVRLSAFVN